MAASLLSRLSEPKKPLERKGSQPCCINALEGILSALRSHECRGAVAQGVQGPQVIDGRLRGSLERYEAVSISNIDVRKCLRHSRDSVRLHRCDHQCLTQR